MPGNSRIFAISKLPHGKQTNFARISAVCLISDFHSEIEEKVLNLDDSVREWKIMSLILIFVIDRAPNYGHNHLFFIDTPSMCISIFKATFHIYPTFTVAPELF